MKKQTLLILFTIVTIGLIGCSKGKKGDIDDLELAPGLTMKVDGVAWVPTMTTLFTEDFSSVEDGGQYRVLISGVRTIEYNKENVDDDVESLTMYVTIPVSKFKNPKGSYPIMIDVAKSNHSWASFSGLKASELFVSYDPGDKNKSVGTLEIKGFEIGEQKILGQNTGKEGYVKLSGSFSFKLTTLSGSHSVNISAGEFDLKNGYGFGL